MDQKPDEGCWTSLDAVGTRSYFVSKHDEGPAVDGEGLNDDVKDILMKISNYNFNYHIRCRFCQFPL